MGLLSAPSKMPGHATSLPAQACHTGALLATINGSVCHVCYALKGNYGFPSVRAALAERLARITDPSWTDDMVDAIVKTGDTHFRWHDSGDVQSPAHLNKILDVCERTPSVRHWLPTKEPYYLLKVLASRDAPENLTIRLSMPMMGDNPMAPSGPLANAWGRIMGALELVGVLTSTVDSGVGHRCPAPAQGGKCGSCRACWDSTIPNTDYHKH